MAGIRFVQNVVLSVEYDGDSADVNFVAGTIYNAKSIDVMDGDYCDVVLQDGSVIKGVHESAFENMGGRVPVSFKTDDISKDESITEEPLEIDNESSESPA